MVTAARLIGRHPTAKNALLFQAASEGAPHVLGQLSPVRKLTLQAVLLAYCTQDGVWQFRASVGGVAAASRFPALNPVREVGLDLMARSSQRAHRCRQRRQTMEADGCRGGTLIQSSRAVGLRRGWMNIHPAHTSKNVLQGQLNFAVVDGRTGDLTESPVPQARVRFGKLGRVERVEEFNTQL